MNRRELEKLARRTMRELDLSRPLDVDQLRHRLGERRGKPIDVVASTSLAEQRTFGITGSKPGASCDVIMYEARTTWRHQMMIILHELAHMICGHAQDAIDHSYRAGLAQQYQMISPQMLAETLGERAPLNCRWFSRWRGRPAKLGRSLYDKPIEWEAEVMATILSSWVPGLGGYVSPAPANALHDILGDVTGW